MRKPPILTEAEREAALAKARNSRAHRAQIKAQVRSGTINVEKVLELAASDEAVAKMRISELLESLPGVGKVRAIGILDRLGISHTRRIMGLGRHQRTGLIKEFAIPRDKFTMGLSLFSQVQGESARAPFQKKFVRITISG